MIETFQRSLPNGTTLSCRASGEPGQPLMVFLHGFPDNAWSYRKQLQVFAEAGYRAVAPFLRGYAPTEIPADGVFDPIALGKDLEALIAALSNDGQARVVGMDLTGAEVVLEGEGLLAQALQHETDHLDGMLYISRLSPEERKIAMRRIRESSWF
jgi:pimeloyl-ACP methyl ester carboxylesterase